MLEFPAQCVYPSSSHNSQIKGSQSKIQKKAGKDSQNTSAMMVATFTGMKYYLGQ
jgi:hypothetical protein